MTAAHPSQNILFSLLTLVACSLAATLANQAHADTMLDDCFARADGDKLVLGNAAIERTFELRGNRLKSTTIRGGDADFHVTSKRPDFKLGETTKTARKVEWTAMAVGQTAIVCAHLEVEVVETYERVDVKRVYRIYPECPVIGCDFYVRRTSEDALEFDPQATVLQSLGLPGRHWQFAAAEFFDRTDSINNLVAESSCVGYNRPSLLRGNVLLAKPLGKRAGLCFVKEAPCSFVQLHYPGHDFSCSMGEIQVVGAGIAPGDLPQDEWIRVYGVATGICDGTELGFLTGLRDYQKRLRRQVPERDDMIMMNTWGDRNRDARVGETFVNEFLFLKSEKAEVRQAGRGRHSQKGTHRYPIESQPCEGALLVQQTTIVNWVRTIVACSIELSPHGIQGGRILLTR